MMLLEAGIFAALTAAVILLLIAYLSCRRRSGAAGRAPGEQSATGPPRATGTKARRGGLATIAGRYEAAGDFGKAAALHLRAGAPLRAAGIYLRAEKHLEAARIFRAEGEHLRAAQALERHGDRLGAAREYAAAGNHARAARLFEEEGRYAAAASAYQPLLGDAITTSNAGHHTRYAALLALSGDREGAAAVYRGVLAAVPENLRAASGLQTLLTRAPSRSLRSVIRDGPLEPRRGMHLWVQAMRALDKRHRADTVFGCLSPDSLTVDGESNVLLEPAAGLPEPYASPQVRAGHPPHRGDDIYSMGVILFEMVTGGTGQFGRRRASELRADVPPWLDDLIGRCTDGDPARRFRTTEEVSAALIKLKSASLE